MANKIKLVDKVACVKVSFDKNLCDKNNVCWCLTLVNSSTPELHVVYYH